MSDYSLVVGLYFDDGSQAFEVVQNEAVAADMILAVDAGLCTEALVLAGQGYYFFPQAKK